MVTWHLAGGAAGGNGLTVARHQPFRSEKPLKLEASVRTVLTLLLLFQILASVLSFVHIGAGSSSHAIKRFTEYGGAELMTLLTICSAAFAWHARSLWPLPVLGLFACLGANVIALWFTGVYLEDLDKWLAEWFFPIGFRNLYALIAVALGGALLLRLNRFHRELLPWVGYGLVAAAGVGILWWLEATVQGETKSETWPLGRLYWYTTLIAGVGLGVYFTMMSRRRAAY